MSIGAMTVDTGHDVPTVWAFDLVREFSLAELLVREHTTLDVRCHHYVTASGDFAPMPDNIQPDSHWVDLSEGLNDADELRNMLEERGLI